MNKRKMRKLREAELKKQAAREMLERKKREAKEAQRNKQLLKERLAEQERAEEAKYFNIE